MLFVELGGLILVQFHVFGFDKVEAIFEDDVSNALQIRQTERKIQLETPNDFTKILKFTFA